MYFNGLIIPPWVKYLKLIHDKDSSIEASETSKSLIVRGEYSDKINGIFSIDPQEIPDTLQFIKLPSSLASVTLSGLKVRKKTYEPHELDIIVIHLDELNNQFTDDNTEVFDERLNSTIHENYDRTTLLIREDERSLDKVEDLLKQSIYLEYEIKDPTAEVGNLLTVIRDKDQILDYYSMDPLDFNGNISVMDWSSAMDGLLKILMKQLSIYDFADPVTTFEQEIPEKKNLLKYNFNELQPSGRGHLIGGHWTHFYMHKMPFDLEFLITSTDTYVRLLHEMQLYLRVTNLGDYWITANDGRRWKVAIEWVFPIGNDFDLNEPKGSSATTGTTIKLSGYLHFYTIAKDEFKGKVERILLELNNISNTLQ